MKSSEHAAHLTGYGVTGHKYWEVDDDSSTGDQYATARFTSDSLYALPTSSTPDYPTPDFDSTQFFGSFWSPDGQHNIDDGFEELKKYLRQGNEFCKDIIEIMKERCDILFDNIVTVHQCIH